ncbi:MAG: hypothetical protein EOP39_18765, partial [Rubrivivax sp.]
RAPAPPAPAWFPQGTAESFAQLEIKTNNAAPILNREDYVPGTYKLSGTGITTAEGALDIRGRGNSTWDWPKKPYRIKLANATALAGMPSSKHWVLLANYADKTLMRNDMAFTLSRQMGMAYTVRDQYVEVTLNGEYRGLYQLAEHIRIAKDRVDVPELKVGDTAADKVSGGYLMEVDFRMHKDYCKDHSVWPYSPFCAGEVNTQRDTTFCVDSKRGMQPACLKEPETLLTPEWAAQRAYIEKYMGDFEAALFSADFKDPANGYAKYVDVDSVIDYYILNELTKNVDGTESSFFMYKKRDGKLHFGPVWDFDLALGNAGYNNVQFTSGWHIRNAPWFTRLFEDPAFAKKVKDRWQALKASGKFEQMLQYAQARATWLTKGQQKNFAKWPIFNWSDWFTRVVMGSYDGEVNEMLRWQAERYAWMDAELSK